jgi:hypothetical protein
MQRNASIDRISPSVTASILMAVVTLVLFFFPLFNGLVGGFLGGYRVGGMRRAMTTAIVPGVIAAVGLYLIRVNIAMPYLNWWYDGLAGFAMIVFSLIGLFVGAAVGGAVAEGRMKRRTA